jgi:hypothetical protein
MAKQEARFGWVKARTDVRKLERLTAAEELAARRVDEWIDEWQASPGQLEAAKVTGWIPPPPELAHLMRDHTEALERLQRAAHRIACRQAGLRPARIPSLPAVARGDKSPQRRATKAFVSRMADYARLFDERLKAKPCGERVQQLETLLERPFDIELRKCQCCAELFAPLTYLDSYCGSKHQHLAAMARSRQLEQQRQRARVAEKVAKNIAQIHAEIDWHFVPGNCCSRGKPCSQVRELQEELLVETQATSSSSNRAKRP